jgi:leucyl-tRNA synthetase
MVPHLTAEAYHVRHGTHIHEQPWPVADAALAAESTVTMVVQVNGKLRDRIEVDATIDEATAAALALAAPKVAELVGAATPRRVVSRPPRLVNIVL